MSIDERLRRALGEDDVGAVDLDVAASSIAGAARRKGRRRVLALGAGALLLGGGLVAVALARPDGGAPASVEPVHTTPAPERARPTADGTALIPPATRRDGWVEYRITALDGTRYLVSVPDSTPGLDEAEVRPVGGLVNGLLGVTSVVHGDAATVVAGGCGGGWSPSAHTVPRDTIVLRSGGSLTTWERPPGTFVRDVYPNEAAMATLELDGWTLVIHGADNASTRVLAEDLRLRVDPDGYPVVTTVTDHWYETTSVGDVELEVGQYRQTDPFDVANGAMATLRRDCSWLQVAFLADPENWRCVDGVVIGLRSNREHLDWPDLQVDVVALPD